MRELDAGRLIARHPYTGIAGSESAITATAVWIVMRVAEGVDMVRRGTGSVRHVPRAILDVRGLQLPRVQDDELISITPIDSDI